MSLYERNLKFLHIWYVCDVGNASTYVRFVLFCCKIGFVAIYTLLSQICFVAIYALLCGEKINQKLRVWRKNEKYEVRKTVIWQSCSNRSKNEVPQSARLSAGVGVQSLFGQCPKRLAGIFRGASLKILEFPKIPLGLAWAKKKIGFGFLALQGSFRVGRRAQKTSFKFIDP